MSILKTIVGRPVTIFIVFMLILGIGTYVVLDLPIDLFPEIEMPTIMVSTSYDGAGPEEIEHNLTRTLEQTLSGVSGLKNITSTSSEGSSLLRLEFVWGTDLSEASNDIRDRLEFVTDYLPNDAGTPQIFKFNSSMIPILFIAMKGNRTPEELRTIAEDDVESQIEQIDGVATTRVMGGRERQIRVEVRQNRLEAYDLTLTQIAGALAKNNIQIDGGEISEGDTDFLIRTTGEFSSLDEIESTVVAYKNSTSATSPIPVRLRDIARIYDGYDDKDETVYINGEPGVFIMVQKQSGENSVEVADSVYEKLEQINSQLPTGIETQVIEDNTTQIRNSIRQLISSALWGIVFAVGILLLFLRRIRQTLTVGLAIPIALLITLMVLYFSGLTLNMMTLAGLVLGIGMVVDSSIVILENIHRYRERNANLKLAAILGSKEMINAIMASTLTTICVFLPLIMFKAQLEMIGVLFSNFALVIIIALGTSLFVAMFLVPVLSSKYLPVFTNRQRPLKNRLLKSIDGGMESLFRGLERGYKNALRAVLNHKLLTIAVIVMLFIGSLVLAPRVGFTLMPETKDDTIEVNVKLPQGIKLEVTEEVLLQLEAIVKSEIPAYKDIIIETGSGGFFGSSESNEGSVSVVLPDFADRIYDSDQVKEVLRAHFNDFPGAALSFDSGRSMTRQAFGQPIDIVISSDTLDRAYETGIYAQELLTQVPEVTETKIDMEKGLPQIEVVIDRERAAAFGLSVQDIVNEIEAAMDGVKATLYRAEEDEFDVVVILDEQDRMSIPDLERIMVMSSTGDRISVSNITRLEWGEGPVDINRENQVRTVHVTGSLLPGIKTNEVQQKIEALLAENIVQDESLTIEYEGDIGSMQEYLPTMLAIAVIALFLVYGVMAGQFENFLDPFIMFFTIPTMLIGIVGMYFATGEQFTMYTAVGAVMLLGIVVNTGIVLVDYTNLLRNRGMSIMEACIEAGGHRLRPILMTTFTTMLAMVPMGFFPGEGAELVQPIGQTVIGGLAASTLMTLFLIPVLYALFNRGHDNNRKGIVQSPAPSLIENLRQEEVHETA
jgi:HAE1 family hydrophobic/amphiphilic exporter-1